MRLVTVMVLAGLAALPLSVSAQAGEEGTNTEPDLQEPMPLSEPAPEEPALQLKLNDAGVEVVPSRPRTGDEYIVASQARKARAWLIGTAVVTAVGAPLLAVGLTYDRRQPPSEDLDFTGVGLAVVGGAMLLVGVMGMVVSGAELGKSKQKLRRLQEAHYGTPRRVQWDLARSRLVF